MRDCHARVCPLRYGLRSRPFTGHLVIALVTRKSRRPGADRIGPDRRCLRAWLRSAPGARPLGVSGLQHPSIGRGVLCFPSLDPSNERDRCRRRGSRGLIAFGSFIKKRNRRSGTVRYVRFIVVPDLSRTKSQRGLLRVAIRVCGHASIHALVAR